MEKTIVLANWVVYKVQQFVCTPWDAIPRLQTINAHSLSRQPHFPICLYVHICKLCSAPTLLLFEVIFENTINSDIKICNDEVRTFRMNDEMC